jgi:hypothetical protein
MLRTMTRVAVIGHVEWVEFVRLGGYPPRGGLAQATQVAEHAAGGAVVAVAVPRSTSSARSVTTIARAAPNRS